MKNKSIFRFITGPILSLVVTFALVSLTSCNNDDDAAPSESIVALAQSQPNLSSLVAALTKYPDLVSTLSGSGQFTVFAPTNDAFTALLATVGQTNINDVPENVLKSLLQYHVVTSGAVLSTQLAAGNVTTANGETIAVTTAGGIRFNNSASVVTADVQASNGVVHIVNQVLVPPSIARFVNTVVEPAYFNKNFTTLIAAVTNASPGILTTLLNSSKKTLFAPTNEAFIAAGITTLPNQATLDAVLTYHVIGSEIRANQLPANTAPANSAITTLGGVFYLSDRGSNGVFINGRTRVTTTDILADNGVVHVIDRTLMPPAQTIDQIVTSLSGGNPAQFTQLRAALNRVPALVTAAGSASSNLTVFAPTDAAFQALYTALGVTNVNQIDLTLLTSVLQHHIVSSPTTTTGRVFSRDLVSGRVATLNGDITLNATAATVTSGNGTVANIEVGTPALINVLGTNGVIHTINKVLVP